MQTRIAPQPVAAPDLIFTGCALTAARAAAPAAASKKGKPKAAARRREVKVGGKRVKTIDVHAHCVIPEAMKLMGAGMESQRGPGIDQVGERRIREMDEQGIDIEALSINPQWYTLDRDTVAEVIRIQNNKLAEFCATYPDRFVAFASVALQYPDMAVEQLTHGVKKLGLRGAAVGASVAGEEFSDSRFHPFWAKAEELGVLIFIHPQSTPDLKNRLKGNGWLANTIGNPLDTTIALQHLIFEGTLDRFPGLKIIAAHGGGYLGSYAARGDHACFVSPQNCNPNITLKKKPSEYLNQLYFDGMVFTPEGLRHLVAQVGASQVMLGTDHPIPWEQHPVDHVFATTTLSDKQKIAILGGNAARLFGLKVA
jgi:aminocarboxymuconate-semialdehyde decarboxylase